MSADTRDEALHRMNNALCAFNMRWKLDGDYLRCVKCKRPIIASHAEPFVHASGCKLADVAEPHPWRTLAGLLAPIAALAAPVEAASAPVESFCAGCNAAIDKAMNWPVAPASPVESDEQCIRCLDYRTHCDCPPAPPAGAVEDATRRERIRQMNYSLWMQDSENGMEPPPEWQAGYRAALATPAARQYYYRVNACKAANHKALDCLCWHDEGTGPLADTPKHIREWRTKPAARQGGDAGGPDVQVSYAKLYRLWELVGSPKWNNDGILDAAIAALSARPAAGDGEPFGWWMVDCNGIGRFTRTSRPTDLDAYRTTPGFSATPLYLAPPAREGVPEGMEAAIHKVARKYLTKRQQGYFMGEIREVLTAAPTAGEGSKDG